MLHKQRGGVNTLSLRSFMHLCTSPLAAVHKGERSQHTRPSLAGIMCTLDVTKEDPLSFEVIIRHLGLTDEPNRAVLFCKIRSGVFAKAFRRLHAQHSALATITVSPSSHQLTSDNHYRLTIISPTYKWHLTNLKVASHLQRVWAATQQVWIHLHDDHHYLMRRAQHALQSRPVGLEGGREVQQQLRLPHHHVKHLHHARVHAHV
eukprot:1159577-Pelagomonas_calceolata.AAC.6